MQNFLIFNHYFLNVTNAITNKYVKVVTFVGINFHGLGEKHKFGNS